MSLIHTITHTIQSIGESIFGLFFQRNYEDDVNDPVEEYDDYGDPGYETIDFMEEEAAPPTATPAARIIDKALFIKQEDRGVIVVEEILDDIPNWVQWDIGRNKVSIVMLDGTMIEITPPVPEQDIEIYRDLNRILLVTQTEERRNIMHYVNFHVQ